MKHHSVSSMIKELLYSDKAHNSAAYVTRGAEAAIGTAYPSREPKFIPLSCLVCVGFLCSVLSLKRKYQIQCTRCVSGITFSSYAQRKMIAKPNNLKKKWEQ